MEIRDAHFPGRAPLDAYGGGGFRFAGMSHLGSILCVPSGIHGWNAVGFEDLDIAAFQRFFDEQQDIEVVLVGTGKDLRPLPAYVKQAFRDAGMMVDSMSTGAAVRTFNVMLSEERAVAAALLAVD